MITRYVRLSVWPRDLVLYYGWPLPLTLTDVLPQALFVLGLLALTAVTLYRRPRVGILGLWFFLTLAPTSSILPIATEVGAERRMYLPLMALVATGGGRPVSPQPRRAPRLSTRAHHRRCPSRRRHLRTNDRIRVEPDRSRKRRTNAGRRRRHTRCSERNSPPPADSPKPKLTSALPHRFTRRRAITSEPFCTNRDDGLKRSSTFALSSPANRRSSTRSRRPDGLLADALTKEGRLDEAAVEYRAMLARIRMTRRRWCYWVRSRSDISGSTRRSTCFGEVRRRDRGDASTLVSLGIAYASTGRLDEAIAAFEKAVAMDPQNRHAQQNLARARAMRARQ